MWSIERKVATVDDVTTEWLTSTLKVGPVTHFTSTRIGTGQIAQCHLLSLSYRGSSSGPSTVVLKTAAVDEKTRQTGLSLGLYEREVRFYNEIAPSLGSTAICKCYHASFHGDGTFCILLADAGPAASGNEIKGVSIEEARLAVSELGKVHGSVLRDSKLNQAQWLHNRAPLSQAMFSSLFDGFQQYYKGQYSEEHLAICKQLVGCFDAFRELQQSSEQIKGLVHGDFRGDNLLFGLEGAENPLTILDWQTVSMGPVMTDLAYLLGAALSIADRRAHADELLDLYLKGLGPGSPITKEIARKGLQEQAFFGVMMSIVSPMLCEHTARGDEMFMVMLSRHCTQVQDLHSLSILPKPTILKPLAPTAEDEGVHPPGEHPTWNESWYFDLIDPESKVGVYVRLGHTPNMKGSWYTAIIARPGKSLVTVTDYECPHPDINSKLEITTHKFHSSQVVEVPLKKVRVNCKGQGERYADAAGVLRAEKGEEADVELDLVWETDGVPYLWRMTTRYEIPCRASGTVVVHGERFEFNNVIAQRDHSHGTRDWVCFVSSLISIPYISLLKSCVDNSVVGCRLDVDGLPPHRRNPPARRRPPHPWHASNRGRLHPVALSAHLRVNDLYLRRENGR
jgi:hypothetical protein